MPDIETESPPVDEQREALRKAHEGTKKATRFLIRAIVLAEVFILAALVIGLFVFRGEFTVYTGTAITLIMIWLAILIPYFAWATYFFNINLGLTNEDWAEIRTTKAAWLKHEDLRDLLLSDSMKLDKLQVLLSRRGLKIPDRNPHHDQTMGLPPGTIRGMLALTVTVGGLAMFIASLGMDTSLAANSFFVDNLEFFKTAFLMVIAFYFGNKSLEILQKEGGSAASQPVPLVMPVAPQAPVQPSHEDKTLTQASLLAEVPDAASATRLKEALLAGDDPSESEAPLPKDDKPDSDTSNA